MAYVYPFSLELFQLFPKSQYFQKRVVCTKQDINILIIALWLVGCLNNIVV